MGWDWKTGWVVIFMRTVLYIYMYAHPRYNNTVGKDRESMRGKGTERCRFWRHQDKILEEQVLNLAITLKAIKKFCLCCILSDYEIEQCKPNGCPLFELRLGKTTGV